jgi:hypothetical protein
MPWHWTVLSRGTIGGGGMKLIHAPRPPGIWDLRTERTSLCPAVTTRAVRAPLPSRTALVPRLCQINNDQRDSLDGHKLPTVVP